MVSAKHPAGYRQLTFAAVAVTYAVPDAVAAQPH